MKPTPHNGPTLLVHGGAWAIPADAAEDHRNGVSRALETGYAILDRGGKALDAVEAAVTVLEDDPTFDAGCGSFLTSDGRVQLDALLMDGGRMKAGGVACVEHLRNPIQAARLVLEQSPHVYFVGEGAEAFAAAHGMPLIDNAELVLDRERERLKAAQARAAAGLADDTFSRPRRQGPETPFRAVIPLGLGDDPDFWSHDTVGAVALDARGNLAAGTSTGGTLNKTPGRVGDSSLIGCGCYADNLSAAVSLTGWGEPIMKLVLGKWATDRVAAGSAPEIAVARSHFLPLQPARRTRRHHPARSRRPLRLRPQHPRHGLGHRHPRRNSYGFAEQRLADRFPRRGSPKQRYLYRTGYVCPLVPLSLNNTSLFLIPQSTTALRLKSMGRIRILSDQVANQIAAGEVVDRPASVVKELLENALDAGAMRIRVEVEAGGRKLIRIADDGHGMNRDDALLAFERHATSKLRTADDLLSICHPRLSRRSAPVHRLRLPASRSKPRTGEDAAGTHLEIAGGKILHVEDAALPRGTTISVADLFFNTPARRKFLRAEADRALARHRAGHPLRAGPS